MHLTFSPAMGESTTLKVPPLACHTSDKAPCAHIIHFQATFDSNESYLRAKSDGVKVEVWTNLPVRGRADGEWGAFQLIEQSLDQEGSSIPGKSNSFSLEDSEVPEAREDNTLHLKLPTLYTFHTDHAESRYSFTFRLTYPSGHIRWLGTHDSNGEFVIKSGFPGMHFVDGWHVRDDGKVEFRTSPICSPFARLDKPADWSLWVLNPFCLPERFTALDSCEGRSLVMVPRASAYGGRAPNPLIMFMLAGKSSSLRVTPDGNISVDDPHAQVTVGILTTFEDPLLQEAIALCNGVILPHNDAVLIAFRRPETTSPFYVLALPTNSLCGGRLAIPFPSLSLITDALKNEGLVLFSPRLRTARFVRASPSDPGNTYFVPSGCEVVVSPAHTIHADDRTWQVALLAPCSSISVVRTRLTSNHLPTPPPSPPVREFIPALVTTDTRREDYCQGTTSVTPLVSPRYDSDSLPRSSHRHRLRLVLVRILPTRILRAYLYTVFKIVVWFWNVFLKALVVRLIGEDIPRRISAVIGFALSKTGPRPRTVTPGSSQSQVFPPNNTKLHGRAGTASEECIATERSRVDIAGNGGGRPDPPTAPLPQYFAVSSGSKILRAVVSVALLGGQSTASLILQGNNSVNGLRASLNREQLPLPSITSLSDDTYLVEFDGISRGGHLEISFDL